MLNIGKLVRDQADYYLDAVARSQEEYYTGAGEAPGYWLGHAAAELGLAGTVSEQELRRMLDGAHPASGEQLLASRGVRVTGYDLTFRAPKSVSLVYGLGTPAVAGQVRTAHEQAIVAALGYLERHAAIVGRGHARERQELTGGFVAAAYQHRTSRAGDPLLHTHVLVAALGRGEDGRWTALDARALHAHAKTAGYLYQAVLRAELTRRLGVAWGPVRQGAADVAGVPRPVIEAFSQRREQIRRWLAEFGCASARAAQRAALATRPAKQPGLAETTLRDRWRQRADAVGFTVGELDRCLGRIEAQPLTAADAATIAAWLVRPEGLTRRVSTFTRRDALRGICQALGQGGSVAEIERLADQFLRGNQQVRLVATQPRRRASAMQPSGNGLLPIDQRRYSTRELLAVEGAVLACGVRQPGQRVGVVSPHLVERALGAQRRLAPEQADMVSALTSSAAPLGSSATTAAWSSCPGGTCTAGEAAGSITATR